VKLGLISRWNATCGVSLHAELIGRELLRRGYTLQVFAPLAESAGRWWHHRLIREDEPFVKRVYTELSPQGEEGRLNPEHVLREPPDVLIVESYEKLPYRDLERLVADLKKTLPRTCATRICPFLRGFSSLTTGTEGRF